MYACQRCHRPRMKGSRFCERHARAREYRPPQAPRRRTKRGKVLKRSPNWIPLRKAFLSKHPLCARCYVTNGITKAAEVVDHVIPVRVKPELELDEGNLQSLCLKCHSKKTGQETNRRVGYDYYRKTEYRW